VPYLLFMFAKPLALTTKTLLTATLFAESVAVVAVAVVGVGVLNIERSPLDFVFWRSLR
jgi:hypothetical protein